MSPGMSFEGAGDDPVHIARASEGRGHGATFPVMLPAIPAYFMRRNCPGIALEISRPTRAGLTVAQSLWRVQARPCFSTVTCILETLSNKVGCCNSGYRP